MITIAHRGGTPENTLEAFERSWTNGVRHFETDVRITLDLHPVLVHDTHYQGLRISKNSVYDLGGVLTLDKLLNWLATKKNVQYELAIEMKDNSMALCRAVETIVYNYGIGNNVTIISFHKRLIRSCRHLKKGLIMTWWSLADNVGFCKKEAVEGLWVPCFRYTHRLSKACRSNGIKLFVWTINADGIVSDFI